MCQFLNRWKGDYFHTSQDSGLNLLPNSLFFNKGKIGLGP